jgi:hypothetical protein
MLIEVQLKGKKGAKIIHKICTQNIVVVRGIASQHINLSAE